MASGNSYPQHHCALKLMIRLSPYWTMHSHTLQTTALRTETDDQAIIATPLSLNIIQLTILRWAHVLRERGTCRLQVTIDITNG